MIRYLWNDFKKKIKSEKGSWAFVAIGLMITAGTVQAVGQYQQGKAQAKTYRYQQQLALQQAAAQRQYVEQQKKAIAQAAESNITLTQGAAAEESKRLAREVTQLTGAQKATIGALGIGGVTAADIAVSSFDRAKLDQMAIRYNANVRSWQFGEEAKRNIWTTEEETKYKEWALSEEGKQYGVAAKQARKAANIATFGTILQTAASSAYMGFKTAPAKPPAKVTP